jgi:hypothetical protein
MRTEEDLRNAFDQLADSAPAADDILAALTPSTRPVRRSRTPLVIGTALATAAAAIAAPLVVSHLKSDPPTGGEVKLSQRSNWLTVPIPAGMRDNGRVYRADYQVLDLYPSGGGPASECIVSAHRNGSFDPRQIPAGSPEVSINGLRGRVITSTETDPVITLPPEYFQAASTVAGEVLHSKINARPMKTVAWQPAKGIWALVSCEKQVDNGWLDAPFNADLPRALTIANSVSATPAVLRTPYRTTYLPAGLSSGFVSAFPKDDGTGAGNGFRSRFGDGDPSTGVTRDQAERSMMNEHPEEGDDLTITYDATEKFLKSYRERPADAMINGRKAWYSTTEVDEVKPDPEKNPPVIDLGGRGVTILGDHFTVSITSHNASVSAAELLKIAEGLDLAPSSTDKSTWFDAATALP